MHRNPRADLLKAAAIFGVVFIHTPGDSWHLGIGFRFCVPAFVTLWAAYFELAMARRTPPQRRAYVRARLARLAVPYLFWTLLYLAILHPPAQWRTTPIHTIVGGWFGGSGWAGQYFFVILFQLTVVAPAFRLAVGRRTFWPILALGLLGFAAMECRGWRSPLAVGINDRLFVYWLPYVALGVGIARGYVATAMPAALAVAGVAALALAPAELSWVEARFPRASPYILISIYVGSAALAVASGKAAGADTGPPAQRPASRFSAAWGPAVAYVGRNTYPIFLANPLAVIFMPRVVRDSLSGGLLGELEHTLLTFGVIAACLALAWAFRKCRLGVLIGDS